MKNKDKTLYKLSVEAGFDTIADVCRKTNTPYSTWVCWENGTNKVPSIVIAYLELYKKIHAILK